MNSFNVCFICTANASRSPMAEALFKEYAKNHNIVGLNIYSAGVSEHARSGISDRVEVAMLRKEGINIALRERVHISEIDIESTDLFVVMEDYHAEELKELGVPESKIYKLAGGINDPFRGTLKEHRRCRDKILNSFDDLTDKINSMR